MTIRDRAIRYLEAHGWVKDHKDKSRYQAFVHPNKNNKAFVGRAGAVRVGECASRSWSVSDRVWKLMQVWEKEQGYVERPLAY